MDKLINDESYKEFFNDNFDSKSHTTSLMQGLSITTQLKKITTGLELLDKELHNQIVTHHDDLLSQATGIETLEEVLQLMKTRIDSLMSSLEKIRTRITEPYDKIVKRTTQLKRLQEACDLLRRIIRLLYLSKRLQTQMQGGAREIVKSAQSLAELDYLMEGYDLNGIDIIETDRRFIRQARKEVEIQARSMLLQGIESKNQSTVATALQVFHNLNILKSVIDSIVHDEISSLHNNILKCVDIQHLMSSMKQPAVTGPGRTALPTNTAAFRAALWSNMEKMMDNIYNSCSQLQHLSKVINKKKDPVSHEKFSEILEKEIMDEFWTSAAKSLTNVFTDAIQDNTYIKQALESEYPKLIRLFNDLWRRLGHVFDESIGDDNTERFESLLRNSISVIEGAYLSKSLSRLFDSVNMAFSTGNLNPPNLNDIETILKVIQSELNIAKIDNELLKSIAGNVKKTLNLFVVKCEQMSATGGEASQVISIPSDGQTRNAELVGILFKLYEGSAVIINSSEKLDEQIIEYLKTNLDCLLNQMRQIITPLLMSIAESLEEIILTLHNEDFSSNDKFSDSNCSLYMKELGDFIQRVDNTYLKQFSICRQWLNEDCIVPLTQRCVQLFIRHVCLHRPVGDGGRLRLAADCAELEKAILPLCKPSLLGPSYKSLRALRPLLFMVPENILGAPTIGGSFGNDGSALIPYSYVMHLILARLPNDSELQSPNQINNWSMSKYSEWMDKHGEKERLSLLEICLRNYANHVQKKGDKEYNSLYPVLMQLMKDAQNSMNGIQ